MAFNLTRKPKPYNKNASQIAKEAGIATGFNVLGSIVSGAAKHFLYERPEAERQRNIVYGSAALDAIGGHIERGVVYAAKAEQQMANPEQNLFKSEIQGKGAPQAGYNDTYDQIRKTNDTIASLQKTIADIDAGKAGPGTKTETKSEVMARVDNLKNSLGALNASIRRMKRADKEAQKADAMGDYQKAAAIRAGTFRELATLHTGLAQARMTAAIDQGIIKEEQVIGYRGVIGRINRMAKAVASQAVGTAKTESLGSTPVAPMTTDKNTGHFGEFFREALDTGPDGAKVLDKKKVWVGLFSGDSKNIHSSLVFTPEGEQYFNKDMFLKTGRLHLNKGIKTADFLKAIVQGDISLMQGMRDADSGKMTGPIATLQKALGLEVDGVFGPATARAFAKELKDGAGVLNKDSLKKSKALQDVFVKEAGIQDQASASVATLASAGEDGVGYDSTGLFKLRPIDFDQMIRMNPTGGWSMSGESEGLPGGESELEEFRGLVGMPEAKDAELQNLWETSDFSGQVGAGPPEAAGGQMGPPELMGPPEAAGGEMGPPEFAGGDFNFATGSYSVEPDSVDAVQVEPQQAEEMPVAFDRVSDKISGKLAERRYLEARLQDRGGQLQQTVVDHFEGDEKRKDAVDLMVTAEAQASEYFPALKDNLRSVILEQADNDLQKAGKRVLDFSAEQRSNLKALHEFVQRQPGVKAVRDKVAKPHQYMTVQQLVGYLATTDKATSEMLINAIGANTEQAVKVRELILNMVETQKSWNVRFGVSNLLDHMNANRVDLLEALGNPEIMKIYRDTEGKQAERVEKLGNFIKGEEGKNFLKSGFRRYVDDALKSYWEAVNVNRQVVSEMKSMIFDSKGNIKEPSVAFSRESMEELIDAAYLGVWHGASGRYRGKANGHGADFVIDVLRHASEEGRVYTKSRDKSYAGQDDINAFYLNVHAGENSLADKVSTFIVDKISSKDFKGFTPKLLRKIFEIGERHGKVIRKRSNVEPWLRKRAAKR